MQGRANKYLYNGKELIEDNGLQYYDYGARMYDPIIGRWGVADSLADLAPRWTPYRYGFNNPIRYTDPIGLFEDDYTAKQDGTIERVETDDDFDRFYVENDKAIGGKAYVGMFNKNSSGLIQLPAEYNFAYAEADLTTIRTFGWQSHTPDSKRYISGPAVSALFGALHETGIKDLSIGQFSKSDGSSPDPSKSHKLGVNRDLRPLRTDMSSNPVTVNDAGIMCIVKNSLCLSFF